MEPAVGCSKRQEAPSMPSSSSMSRLDLTLLFTDGWIVLGSPCLRSRESFPYDDNSCQGARAGCGKSYETKR